MEQREILKYSQVAEMVDASVQIRLGNSCVLYMGANPILVRMYQISIYNIYRFESCPDYKFTTKNK